MGDIELGDIFRTPEIDLKTWRYAVSGQPKETLKDKHYLLSRIQRGIAVTPWEVQHGRDVINCKKNIRMPKEAMDKFRYLGRLPEEISSILPNALHFAEKSRLFGESEEG